MTSGRARVQAYDEVVGYGPTRPATEAWIAIATKWQGLRRRTLDGATWISSATTRSERQVTCYVVQTLAGGGEMERLSCDAQASG